MSARNADPANGGFTLVELLVVLSLIALLGMLTVAATGQFGHLIKRQRLVEDRLALEQTLAHITNLLEAAETLHFARDPAGPVRLFEGHPDLVRFFAFARRGARRQGLREVILTVEGGDDAGKLVQTLSPRRLSSNKPESVEKIALIEQGARISFEYLAEASAPGENPVWHSEWRDASRLPVAVTVTLEALSDTTAIQATSTAILLSN